MMVLKIYVEQFSAKTLAARWFPPQAPRIGEQNDPLLPTPHIHSIKQRERRFGWCAAEGAAIALNLCRGIKHDAVMSARRGRCCKQAASRPSCGSVNFCREARLELENTGRCSDGGGR